MRAETTVKSHNIGSTKNTGARIATVANSNAPQKQSEKQNEEKQNKGGKNIAVASRQSEPIIAAVERAPTIRETPGLEKTQGAMPAPFASFDFR